MESQSQISEDEATWGQNTGYVLSPLFGRQGNGSNGMVDCGQSVSAKPRSTADHYGDARSDFVRSWILSVRIAKPAQRPEKSI